MKILITTVQLGTTPVVETETIEVVDLVDAVLYDCCNAVTREEIHHGEDYVLVKKAVVSKPHLTLVK